MAKAIGIDFGTTNSVVAVLEQDGSVAVRRHILDGAAVDVFRSILCFWNEELPGRSVLHEAAGPAAIASYLDDPLESRLIMSMKTYLAQRSFSETRIFKRRFTLERLVATFLTALLGDVARPEALKNTPIVVGRPVRFAGELTDDAFGAERLRASYAAAGLPDVRLAFEPEGAGYRFARGVTREATVLVGDFGGGTSDFSVMRFEPAPTRRVVPLGHAGIGIAGDVFDYRIIDNVVSPLLGKGDSYRVMGKRLPVPPDYYAAFARWHRLSLMRTPKILREIAEVAWGADHPERLKHLIALIDDERGYLLYQAVAAAKAALSHDATAPLSFRHKNFVVDTVIARTDFEAWIADDLRRLAATVDQALANAGITADAVDHVFLTGGTSFVPAVRALFAERFGPDKLAAGGEFVSVAEGLALIAGDAAAPT
jgi:hypothetical chaperone protein